MLQINSPEIHEIIEAFCNKEIKRAKAIKLMRSLGVEYYDARELTQKIIVFQRGSALDVRAEEFIEPVPFDSGELAYGYNGNEEN